VEHEYDEKVDIEEKINKWMDGCFCQKDVAGFADYIAREIITQTGRVATVLLVGGKVWTRLHEHLGLKEGHVMTAERSINTINTIKSINTCVGPLRVIETKEEIFKVV